jgi:cytochrome c biogenesis protein CcdA
MPSRFKHKQKSLERRFLLVLGVAVFLGAVVLGLLLMFDQLNLALSPTQRYVFGGLIIVYGVIRVARIFKKEPPDEEA